MDTDCTMEMACCTLFLVLQDRDLSYKEGAL